MLEFGFKNAIIPLDVSHIRFLLPPDPTKDVDRLLERRSEGVYLVSR